MSAGPAIWQMLRSGPYPPYKRLTDGAAFLIYSQINFNPQHCRYACSNRSISMTSTLRIVLFCASTMAFALTSSGPLLATEGTTKTLAENDKVQVIDNVVPPGAMSPITSRLGLVAYYVQGDTSERGY